MASDGNSVSFLRHAIIYGIGALATPLAGFVVVPIYTHYMEPAEYGSLQLIYRIGGVFHICLMIGGIRLAAFYLYGKSDDDHARHHAAASITAFTFLVLLVGALLTIACGKWLNDLISFGDAQLLILGVLTLKVRSLSVMPLALMQARFESVAFVVVNLAIAATQVALTALAVAGLGWGVWGVLVAVVITHGLFGITLTMRELARTTWKPDGTQLRQIARFALPFIPAGLCFFIMNNGDQLFLMKFGGAAVVGVYALGYQFVQVLETVATGPLFQVWHPWMYQAFKSDNGPQLLGKAATRIIGVFAFVATGLVMFRVEVIQLMSSSAYSEAAMVIPVLALAYFHVTSANLIDASFYVTQKTYLKPIVASASAVVFIVAYSLLIPPLGAMGAAYATLIGFAFHHFATMVVAQRIYWIAYEPIRILVLLASAATLAAVAHYLGVGVIAFVLKCVLLLAWPMLLWIAGFLSEEEQGYVINLWKKALTVLGRMSGRSVASETS